MNCRWSLVVTAALLTAVRSFATPYGKESHELKIEPATWKAHIAALPMPNYHPLLQMLGMQNAADSVPTDFSLAVGQEMSLMLKLMDTGLRPKQPSERSFMQPRRRGSFFWSQQDPQALASERVLTTALKLNLHRIAPEFYPESTSKKKSVLELAAKEARTLTAREIAKFTSRAVFGLLGEPAASDGGAPPVEHIAEFLGRGLQTEDRERLARHLPALATPELQPFRRRIHVALRLDEPGTRDNLTAHLKRSFDSALGVELTQTQTAWVAENRTRTEAKRIASEIVRLRPVSDRIRLDPSYGTADQGAMEPLRELLKDKIQRDPNKLANIATLNSEEFRDLRKLYRVDTLLRVLYEMRVHSLYVSNPTRPQWAEDLAPHGALLTSQWVTQFTPAANLLEFEALYKQLRGEKAWGRFLGNVTVPEINVEVRPMRVDDEVDDWRDIHELWAKYTLKRKGGMGYFELVVPSGNKLTLWAPDLGRRIRDGKIAEEFGMGRLEDWFVTKLYHPTTKRLIAGIANRFDHAHKVVIAGMGGFDPSYKGGMPNGSFAEEKQDLHLIDRLMYAAIEYLGNKKKGEPGYGYYWGKGHDGGQPGQHVTEATLAFNKIKDGSAFVPLDEVMMAFIMIAPSPLGMGNGNQKEPTGVLGYPFDPVGWLVRDYFDRRDRGEKPVIGALLPKQAIPELVNPALGIDLVHGAGQIYKELVYWKPAGSNAVTHSPSDKTGMLVVPISATMQQ